MGVIGGAMSAGQLIIVPLAVVFTLTFGWRQSFIWLGILLFIVAVPLTFLFIRNDPAEKGLKAFGAGQAIAPGGLPAAPEGRTGIGDAMRVPAFWLLAGSFFVCGYTSNGLVLTHLVPHAAEHGFSEMHAAQALAVLSAGSATASAARGRSPSTTACAACPCCSCSTSGTCRRCTSLRRSSG
jgi:MFS family permease